MYEHQTGYEEEHEEDEEEERGRGGAWTKPHFNMAEVEGECAARAVKPA